MNLRKVAGRLPASVLIVLCGLGLASGTVGAQTPQSPPVSGEATQFAADGNSSILVVLTATKATKGTIRVTSSYPSELIATARVEMQPGDTNRLWIPIANKDANSYSVSAPDLVLDLEKGNDIAIQINPDVNAMAVAVMPSALGTKQQPNTSSTISGQSTARFATVTVDDLEQRAWILSGFSVLSTTASELSGASADAQSAVLRWVRLGGELLIDDDVPVPGLGSGQIQPTAASPTVFGEGLIRRSLGRARSGTWEEILTPQPIFDSSTNSSDSGWLTSSSVRLPPVGLMLGAMLGYAAIAGPVIHTVLRQRKRPMAIWTVGPAFALVTTVVVLALGLTLRSQAKDQYGIMTEYGEHGSSVVLGADTKSGKHDVNLPSGWTVANGSGRSGIVVNVGRPLKATVEVPPGGVRLVESSGPAPSGSSPMTGKAISLSGSASNDITVEITNTSSKVLNNPVAWILDSSGQLIAAEFGSSVAPGANASVSMNSSSGYLNRADRDLLERFRPRDRDTVYVTAEYAGPLPKNAPLTAGKQVYSGVLLRIPIADNYVQRSPYVGYNSDNVTRTVIEEKANGTAFVTGSVWINGQFVDVANEPLADWLAPNGILLTRGNFTIVDTAGKGYASDSSGASAFPAAPPETVTPPGTAFPVAPSSFAPFDTTIPLIEPGADPNAPITEPPATATDTTATTDTTIVGVIQDDEVVQ